MDKYSGVDRFDIMAETMAAHGYLANPDDRERVARLLRNFPAPSEPAKDAMELVVSLAEIFRTDQNGGAIYRDCIDRAAALIQSSFEAWASRQSASEPSGEAWRNAVADLGKAIAGRVFDKADPVVPALERLGALLASRPASTDEKALRQRVKDAVEFAVSDGKGYMALDEIDAAFDAHESPKEQA